MRGEGGSNRGACHEQKADDSHFYRHCSRLVQRVVFLEHYYVIVSLVVKNSGDEEHWGLWVRVRLRWFASDEE